MTVLPLALLAGWTDVALAPELPVPTRSRRDVAAWALVATAAAALVTRSLLHATDVALGGAIRPLLE
jgi:hypothetical protein